MLTIAFFIYYTWQCMSYRVITQRWRSVGNGKHSPAHFALPSNCNILPVSYHVATGVTYIFFPTSLLSQPWKHCPVMLHTWNHPNTFPATCPSPFLANPPAIMKKASWTVLKNTTFNEAQKTEKTDTDANTMFYEKFILSWIVHSCYCTHTLSIIRWSFFSHPHHLYYKQQTHIGLKSHWSLLPYKDQPESTETNSSRPLIGNTRSLWCWFDWPVKYIWQNTNMKCMSCCTLLYGQFFDTNVLMDR